MPVFEPNLVIW